MDRPLLFTADWCNHCISLKYVCRDLLDQFTIIDYDKNQELAKDYKIKLLPTIVKGDLKLENPERKQVEEFLKNCTNDEK